MNKVKGFKGAATAKIIQCPPDVSADAWHYLLRKHREVYVEVRWRGQLIGIIGVRVPR